MYSVVQQDGKNGVEQGQTQQLLHHGWIQLQQHQIRSQINHGPDLSDAHDELWAGGGGGQVRGVEEDTSALSSRRSCHARSARKAPTTTCIATATPAKAIPSRSPKLSRRRLGGGAGGGGRCLQCRCRCRRGRGGGGGDAASEAGAACRCVAGTVGGDGAAAAAAKEEERDGEARRRSGTRRVSVAARAGGEGRGRGAMGGGVASRVREARRGEANLVGLWGEVVGEGAGGEGEPELMVRAELE